MHNTEHTLPGIDVLNTGYGDFELRFDPDKPDEVQKAKETITAQTRLCHFRAAGSGNLPRPQI